jgi:pimeloyl-ACP methyl ester carboxylesterase
MEPPILPLLQRSPAGRILAERFHREAIGPSHAAFARGDLEEGVRRFVDGIAGHSGSFDAIPPRGKERLLAVAPELQRELCTPPDTYMPPLDPAELARVTTPVLLVQGERSPKLFHLILNELELSLPDSERAMIPRAGHSVHIDHPNHLNGVLEQFLAKHRRS